jgi:hypothetical protein
MTSIFSFCLAMAGLAVGVKTRNLHNEGKFWKGNLLFGGFIVLNLILAYLLVKYNQ